MTEPARPRSTLIDNLDDLAVVSATLVPHRDPIDAAQAIAVVDATADAGFTGICAWVMHHDWAVADGLSSPEFLDHHQRREVAIHSMSVLTTWLAPDGRAAAEDTRHIVDVAARAGAHSVVAVCLDKQLPPLEEAARRMADVCDIAAGRGLAVSIEFIPGYGLPDLKSTMRLIEETDRTNLGLVLDAYQWFNAPDGPDVAALYRVPAERIHILQLNDMRRRPSDGSDAGSAPERLMPGDGDIDLVGLLNVLHEVGASPVVATEVLSPALLGRLGQAEMARAQFTATAAVIERHWAALSA